MAFPPLALGTTATPITVPNAAALARLLGCGPLDLAMLNGLLKALGDRIDAVDAADNAITAAAYDTTTNALTFTLADGTPVVVDLTALAADAASGANITASSYNPATNALTLTQGGASHVVDLTATIADAVAGAALTASSYNAATNALTLTQGGASHVVDLSPVIADAVATNAPGSVSTTTPLTGGGATNTAIALALDIPALVSDLDASFVTPAEQAAAITASEGVTNAAINTAVAPLQATTGSNANGYWEVRQNGIIEQWGVVSFASTEAVIAHTFPVPFTNLASVSIQATNVSGSSFGNDIWTQIEPGWTINDFSARQQSSATTPPQSGGFTWRAIGL